MICPNCGKNNVADEGIMYDAGKPKQRFWCVICDYRWLVEPVHEAWVNLKTQWS